MENDAEDVVELRQVVEFVQRRKAVILLITVVTFLTALFLSFQQKPLYQSTATLLLKEKDVGFATLFGNFASQLSNQPERSLQTTVRLITVRPILESVVKKLKLNMAPEELAKKITIQVEQDANLLTLSVTDESAFRAQRIAQAVVEEYLKESRETAISELTRARQEVFQKLKDTETEIIALANETAKRSKVPDDLKAKLDMATGLYVMLAEKHEQLKIYEELQTSEAKLVSAPVVPKQPISPHRTKNGLIGLISGLFVGLFVAVGLEMVDNTVKTSEEMEKLFNLPLVGQIPYDRVVAKSKSAESLVVKERPKSGTAESFRTLRTNLEYFHASKPIKCILITSALPEDGKSFVALNLASSFVETGKNVFLVSADLRKPQLHNYIGCSNSKGLSAYLVGYLKTTEEVIHHTPLSQLFFVPSGPQPPNPVELLESEVMQSLMAELKERADLIIIDSPPLLSVADTLVLCRYADGLVLVTDITKTTRDTIKHLNSSLSKINVRKIGIVVNKMSLNGSYYGYYGYEYTKRNSN